MEINLSSNRKSSGIIGKLMCSTFGLFFAVIGFFFVVQASKGLQEAIAMQKWESVPCTIVTSKMEDAGEDFRLVLSYTYNFEGQSYTAERYGNNRHFTAEGIGEVDRMQKSLPPGKKTRCHVDPLRPTKAVFVLPTVKGSFAAVGFTLLFPAFGLLFVVAPWLKNRKKEEKTMPSTKAKSSGKKPMIIFGSIFALVGLALLKPILITPLQKTQDAKTWESVPATVVSSKVKSHDSDDGTTYSVYIAYRFTMDDVEYVGDKYTFMGGSSSGYKSKAEVVRQYPRGHTFDVFVNPEDPSESVIKREASLTLLFGLIPLIFAGAGFAIIIAGVRKTGKLDPQQAQDHIVTLKGPSPLNKAIGFIIFSLIWNSIVFFLAKSDAPLMFPIVFGLFGVLMIGGAIHAILAIFNPRPVVEMTPGDVRPGTSVALRWRTSGRIDRVEKFTIEIQCLEIRTESSGSGNNRSTRTIKKPVYENLVLETDSQTEISQGTLQFTVPEDQQPSDKNAVPQIKWQLILKGEIPRWPDIKEELEFLVYPHEE